MSEPLVLTLNGRERAVRGVESPAMLDAVLVALELRADRVAVELNGELASRTAWPATAVKSGDRLEIVHFVGGGCTFGLRQSQPALRQQASPRCVSGLEALCRSRLGNQAFGPVR